MRIKIAAIILLFTTFSFAQLSNFTLTVSKTDETCTANASLTFNVSGTTTGSTISYSIYKLPDVTTPISVTNGNSLSGLSTGTYRVIATQALGSNSGTQQQDITISNNIVNLVYAINGVDEVCGNDGKITVTIQSGTATGYEIISGPIIRPLQTSNVFQNLVAGIYQIRVFDACGEGVVQTFTLFKKDIRLDFDLEAPSQSSCTTIAVGVQIHSLLNTGYIVFPLTVILQVNQPTGTVTYNSTIPGNGPDFGTPGVQTEQTLPFFPNQSYTYSYQITDGCGVIYNLPGVINLSQQSMASYALMPVDCSHKDVLFRDVQSVILTSAPSSFPVIPPHDYTSQISGNQVLIQNLTAGTYTFSVIDICGLPSTITFEIPVEIPSQPIYTLYNQNCMGGSVNIVGASQVILISAPAAYTNALPYDYTTQIDATHTLIIPFLPNGTYTFSCLNVCGSPRTIVVVIAPSAVPPSYSILEGCDIGYGTVKITGFMTAAYLTQAPAAYTAHTLPFDLAPETFAVGISKIIVLQDLPPGVYVVQSYNECNMLATTTFTIAGYAENTDVTILPHCGSFDLELQHTSNNNSPATYWLQKYNPANSTWGHPVTGGVYSPGSYPGGTNSIQLTNNTINYNIGSTGHFRILKAKTSYVSQNVNASYCYRTIKEFDFSGQPQITRVYAVSCGVGYDVIVDAVGTNPLIYRIITKDGNPFLINNGNSSVFTGLAPGVYGFQVEDGCGNILNSSIQVVSPQPLDITPDGFCDGQPASLSVPNFSYLQYKWWKNSNPATILSTTNSLNFSPFVAATQSGAYTVQIIYSGNPSSCLNQTIQYTISPQLSNPNAGGDNALSYCGNQGNVNLFNLLTGSYDTGGVWTETTSSGLLSGNNWNSAIATPGTYIFKYKVTGYCNIFDEATVSITLKPIPTTPTITSDALLCEGSTLHLNTTTIANATYAWTGPNSFTSSQQNPVIESITTSNSGTYSLVVTVDGCPSQPATFLVNIGSIVLAGTGTNQSFCGNQGQIDLFNLLTGTYTTGGTWVETSAAPSGMLTGNIWDSTTVSAGVYTFDYSVSGSCNTDNEQVSITLKSIPSAPSITGNSSLCAGNSIQLNTPTVANATYSWTGPNGFTSFVQNPTIPSATTSNSGTYSLVVTVDGCPSQPTNFAINVQSAVSAGVGANPTYCGNQGQIDLFNLLTGTYTTGGTWVETSAAPSGMLTGNIWDSTTVSAGVYTFVYSVSGACNTDNEQVSITLNPIPTTPPVTGNATICAGNPIQLNTPTVAGANYSWTGPNGFTSSVQNPTIPSATTLNSGTYSLVVTVDGCPSQPANFAVNVQTAVSAGIGANPTYCGNQGQIDLFNLLTGSYATGGTWIETSTSPSGTLTGNIWDSTTVSAGIYTFNYTIVGCTTEQTTVSIIIQNSPAAPTVSASSINCSDGIIELFASTIPGVNYSWTGPNGFSSSLQNPTIPNASSANSGQYTVFVSANGCSSAIATVAVLVNENPDFEVVQGCNGNKFRVEAIPVSNSFDPTNVTYTWTGPNGFTSAQNPPNIAGQQQGIYTVTITNSSGCSKTISFELSDIAAQIPKGISPDGDGLNDEFNLIGLCVKQVAIFNRYGVKVFEKEGYTNEWHGQSKSNEILPSGTYYYQIEFEEGTTATGWVYLALEK